MLSQHTYSSKLLDYPGNLVAENVRYYSFSMAVHALLSCEDEKAAAPINMALGELGISVEPCVEVFAAAKKMTTEPFDTVILIAKA